MTSRSTRPTSAAAIACLVLIAMTSCATTWGAIKLGTGHSAAPHEDARRVIVPLADVTELLTVRLYPSVPTSTTPSSTSGAATATATSAQTSPGSTSAPQVECRVVQSGREVLHQASTRYGKRWKITTAIFVVLEGAAAAAYLLSERDDPESLLSGLFFAADAAGTAALFFIPRRDEYTQTEQTRDTPIRTDCPEGLTLYAGERGVGVDADGQLALLGDEIVLRAVIEEGAPLIVASAGYRADLRVDPSQRCHWARERRHASAAALCQGGLSALPLEGVIRAPAGTFTSIPDPGE